MTGNKRIEMMEQTLGVKGGKDTGCPGEKRGNCLMKRLVGQGKNTPLQRIAPIPVSEYWYEVSKKMEMSSKRRTAKKKKRIMRRGARWDTPRGKVEN